MYSFDYIYIFPQRLKFARETANKTQIQLANDLIAYLRKDIDADVVTEFVVTGVSAENAMEITTRMNNDGSAPEKLDNGEDQKGGLTILFDFGGNPEKCDIEIFDIAIQKSK